MLCHEGHNALLDAVEIIVGLRHAYHDAVESHRVDRHGGRRRDHAALCRHGQRHTDRMSPAQHQRDARLLHPGDQLRDGEARLHVPTHGVEQDKNEAMKCYQKAADAGDSYAMFALGNEYARGEKQDEEKALMWYRKAAEVGLELVMKERRKWASPDIEYLDN